MATYTKWRPVICAFCLILQLNSILASKEVITKLTTGFGKVLNQCRSELNVGDNAMEDFANFWREEYQLLNRDFGCVMHCMVTKLDLINDDMKMHHGKAHEFAKAHGADDALAKQLVTMVHDCETANDGITDLCSRTLEASKCFRTKIHELKWAPSMEAILDEFYMASSA